MAQHTDRHPSQEAGEGRIFGLDLVRAFAALSVAAAHAFVPLYPHIPYLFFLGGGGGWGVELFFVLSGFLIGGILLRTGEKLADGRELGLFYLRRWLRTLPIFFLFWVVAVFIQYQWNNYPVSPGVALGHLFFVRTLWDIRITFMPESWSLAVEEWFYLLFPAMIWLGLRLRARFEVVFLSVAALLFVLSTGTRFMNAWLHPEIEWSSIQRCVVLYRFDALMFGIVAAWVHARFPVLWRKYRAVCGVLGLILTVFIYLTQWRFDGGISNADPRAFFGLTFRFTFISLGFALLLPWASEWRLSRESPASGVIRRLALWSYVIYLMHQPWYAFAHRWSFLPKGNSFADGLIIFALTFGGAIVASGLVYWLCERPIMAFRETASQWYRRRFLGLHTGNRQ